jgi:hypothetical protein
MVKTTAQVEAISDRELDRTAADDDDDDDEEEEAYNCDAQ